MKTPKQVLAEWIQYMNSRNIEKLMELYHPEAVNMQMAVGHPLNGRAAIKADYTAYFTNIPDFSMKPQNIFQDGDWGMVEWNADGTFRATGKGFKLSGCGFFQILNEKIIFQRGYWDRSTLFTQVDLPVDERNFS